MQFKIILVTMTAAMVIMDITLRRIGVKIEMFKRIKPEMDAYFENVEKVGKILEEAGAPIVLD